MVAGAAMARVLLGDGANHNRHDSNGDSPLHRALKSRIAVDPTEFVRVLLDAGAAPNIRNAEGRTAFNEALIQQSKSAETHFPVRTIGPKRLKEVIELLRTRTLEG